MLIEPDESLLKGLKARYGEPHRAYHTWEHIEALLGWFHRFEGRLHDPTAVLWALYWHDAIYDPASASNEAESAALLVDEAAGHLSDAQIDAAATIIGATAKHEAPSGISGALEDDLKFFLDIDLAIFGQQPDVFDAYEEAIRIEYSFVEQAFYDQARANILKNFLTRKRIYFTDVLRDLWEEQARENLKRSIARLS